jgi:hypothetical protein
LRFWAKNGGDPVSISNRMQPKVHQSVGFPCPYFKRISGARYSGVPHMEKASVSEKMFIFESPKSVILIYPKASIKTFSGLRSRYIILLLCRNSSAKKI